MAGQQTMSDQNFHLTSQNLNLSAMLTGLVMLRQSHCSFVNKQSKPQLQILDHF